LKIVTPNCEILKFGGKVRKDATGYNMKDIFIGSEGTLGFITEITFSLLPLPKYSIDLLLAFDRIDDASNAVVKIIHSGIFPQAIEFMEKGLWRQQKIFLETRWLHRKVKHNSFWRIDGFDRDIVDKKYRKDRFDIIKIRMC